MAEISAQNISVTLHSWKQIVTLASSKIIHKNLFPLLNSKDPIGHVFTEATTSLVGN